MLNRKIALTLTGLLAANVAFALPGFSDEAPESSVDACVAAVDENVDFANANLVVHNVETEERRVSGHKMASHTIVMGEGETVIREYASKCSINGQDEIKYFKIRQKGE